MPGLTLNKPIGHAKFASHGLKMPTQAAWRQPRGEHPERHYGDAFPDEDKVANPRLAPPFFTPQNDNRHHQASCDSVGQFFRNLHDTMLDAGVSAHGTWKASAHFAGLTITGPAAVGAPGCLVGPELTPMIKGFSGCVAWDGVKAKWRDAVATGVGQCCKDWQRTGSVPGLPWYPAFAAFPGPVAPPMPNVPTPVISCTSALVQRITEPTMLAMEMARALDATVKQSDHDGHHRALFDAVGSVLAVGFATWLAGQQVLNVMSQGPVPSFAPPLAPVGPVVGGANIPTPGHLAA